MVYERVRTYRRRVDGATAYRVLSRRFDTSVLAQITEYKLEDILDLAAKYAPRNKKQQAREDLLNKLIQAGAVYTEEVERYQRRPANEKKLVPDTPAE
jgi:myo-inositol-1-phosphate synthase